MMRRRDLLGALGAAQAAAPQTAGGSGPYDAAFWKIWGDGQAELAGYDLTYPRYGQPRKGTATTIFVTEPFSNSSRVKADPGKHPPQDEFPVMKLNLVIDFQTGIYDYNEMTSSFVALKSVNGRAAGTPTKVSFSSQEWCGHVWHHLLFDQSRVRNALHSYFDGEADQLSDMPNPADSACEDQALLWARGMAQPFLRPGQSRQLPYLPSLQSARHAHEPLQWQRATFSRGDRTEVVAVPAGRFSCDVLRVTPVKGPERTYFVESSGARRIVKWEAAGGEKGELTGSARLKYWDLNREGGEKYLAKLGLKPRLHRMT
jgi:hypothetical protein